MAYRGKGIKIAPVESAPLKLNTKGDLFSGPGGAKKTTFTIEGKKYSTTGLSRRQRSKLVKAAIAKMGSKNLLAQNALKYMANLAGGAESLAATLETLKQGGNSERVRQIRQILDEFMNDVSQMTPEQIKALAPIFTQLGIKVPNTGNQSGNYDSNTGTIIL